MKKVAFVSGSSRGIGKAIAVALSNEDYVVYVNGRTEADVLLTTKEIGKNAHPLTLDLTVEANVEIALKKITTEQGQLDLVVSNVGRGRIANVIDVPMEDFRKIFEVNFFSAVNLCQLSLKHMTKGQIVIIASIAGVESVGASSAYTSAKAALLGFAKSFSDLAATHGVRVNSVSPGNIFFEGGSWQERLKKNEAGVKQMLNDKVPLKRFGTPEEIAEAVLFLTKSEFTTGTNLIVDGGQTRRLI